MNKFKEIEIPTEFSQDGGAMVTLQAQIASNAAQIFIDFETFKVAAEEALAEAHRYMTQPNSNDTLRIREQLRDLTSISSSLGELHADANSFVTLFRVLYFIPKAPKLSEADRKLYTETKMLVVQNLMDKIRYASENLERKITAFQSILKNKTVEIGRNYD